MEQSESRASIGPVQVGVVVLALATAGLHLYEFLIDGFLGEASMLPLFQFLFVGNFLAYLILLGVLFLPGASRTSLHPFARMLLIAIALASIASYFRVEVYGLIGNVSKVTEVLLILFVTADAATSDDEFAGGGTRGALSQAGIGAAIGVAMFLFLSLFIGNN